MELQEQEQTKNTLSDTQEIAFEYGVTVGLLESLYKKKYLTTEEYIKTISEVKKIYKQ